MTDSALWTDIDKLDAAEGEEAADGDSITITHIFLSIGILVSFPQ